MFTCMSTLLQYMCERGVWLGMTECVDMTSENEYITQLGVPKVSSFMIYLIAS
jgi:hypothetical protein